MKKILLSLFTILVLSACSSIIEEDLQNKLDDLKDRVTALEEMCSKTNTNISSIQSLLDAVNKKNYITSVTPVSSGYTVKFSTGESITIYNGEDGEDGYVPKVSIAKDTDGIFYWTLDGSWMKDASGNKIKAENKVPKFKIEEEYWHVSYDNGVSWTKLDKASGDAGDPLFLSVNQKDASVEFVLNDGTSFTLPKVTIMSILIANESDQACLPGQSISVDYTLEGIYSDYTIEALGGNGWISTIEKTDETTGKIIVTAPTPAVPGKVLVLLSDDRGQTVMKSLAFEAGLLALVTDAFKLDWKGGSLEVPVSTNLSYTVNVPDEASWLSFVSTKAMRDETLEFSLQEFPGEHPMRTADVQLLSNTGSVLETITIAQTSEPTSDPIIFADKYAKQACIKAGCDINGDGEISYKEASEIESLPNSMFEGFREVVSFDELKYFTKIPFLPDGMFYDCRKLKSVTIPDNVTGLGYNLFVNCYLLENVSIPANVTSIGHAAFVNCRSLTSIELPDSITYLGNSCFDGCSMLKEVNIPKGISYLDSYVFRNCTSLESVEVPDNVTRIGDRAFAYCKNLQSVVLPDTITDIDYGCFMECSSLKQINIPKGVKVLESDLFKNCISLSSIEIPDGVTTIKHSCFFSCRSLKTIHIPESVTLIERAILAQNNLETITGKYTTPDNNALIFQNILVASTGRNFTSFTVPAGVTTIGSYCFHGSRLESIILNEELVSVENNAFQSSMVKEIYLPSSVTSIGIDAFDNSELEKIVIPEDSKLKIIEDGAFSWTSLESIDLPDSVESMGHGSFSGCSLKHFSIPPKVTVIPERLCYYCLGLESVKFEGAVTVIREGAFWQCRLKEITIPASVKSIEFMAFYDNGSIENVYCYPTEPPGIGLDAFTTNQDSTYSIYVPAESYDKYKNSSSWTQFASRLKPMETL